MFVLTHWWLKSITLLLLPASFFAVEYLGTSTKLEILARKFLQAVRRVLGIPNFRTYALADSIKEILSKSVREIL
jgi:hypothetical protein